MSASVIPLITLPIARQNLRDLYSLYKDGSPEISGPALLNTFLNNLPPSFLKDRQIEELIGFMNAIHADRMMSGEIPEYIFAKPYIPSGERIPTVFHDPMASMGDSLEHHIRF
ncbi:MAG: hypothetical protein WAZ18_05630 [Alphaproteobacteria bacterium]